MSSNSKTEEILFRCNRFRSVSIVWQKKINDSTELVNRVKFLDFIIIQDRFSIEMHFNHIILRCRPS